ncbi:MAG: hypothetical protein P8M25_01380 [Paracoccaceae bacterium]|nr:hypothetical protein [Paracoccaceae bacterium]
MGSKIIPGTAQYFFFWLGLAQTLGLQLDARLEILQFYLRNYPMQFMKQKALKTKPALKKG